MQKPATKEQVESLFFEARQLSGGARASFLQQCCQDDADLRSELDALLSADGEADAFFGEDASASNSPSTLEGQIVGRYKLLERIGEGGFGVVYMAQQLRPIRRRVAVKVIKPGMDSREVIARFEAERQALAMMDHPSIARVLDGGTTEFGHPYFVMELVHGFSITQFCDDNHLDLKARLKLFTQVCRAVQHAHQKGIIHRDLKPANVLITLHDGIPVPKVIDFGVAKALDRELTDKTVFTRYGQFVGTPQYMSPEQAEMSGLGIDTRSDIYSLGVLLYELLTGHTPIDVESLRSAGYDEMRRMIQVAEPTKPSTRLSTLDNAKATLVAQKRSMQPSALSKSISGDLDWIVMKLLDKDRNRRYESAIGLAEDIECFLNHEPVSARPPTIAYQLSKLYRRHQAAVSTVAVVGILLVMLATLTTWAWISDSKLRAQAEEEARQAKASLDVLTLVLRHAAPTVADGPHVTLNDFLRSFTNEMNQREFGDEKVEANVRMTLGETLLGFSQTEAAQQQLQKAEAAVRRAYTGAELAESLYKLGRHAVHGEALSREAFELIRDDAGSSVLTVDILTQLSNKTWDRPIMSESYARQACTIFETLSDKERAQIDAIPHESLTWKLINQDRAGEALQQIEKAFTYAAPGTATHGGLLVTKCAALKAGRNHTEARRVAESARALALSLNDAALLRRSWRELFELEISEPFHDQKRQIALAKNCYSDVLAHWHDLHAESPDYVLGYLFGALTTAGLGKEAEQINALAASLSPLGQQNFHHYAAHWFRMYGEIGKAIAGYRQSIEVHPPVSHWSHTQPGRGYAGVRDFQKQVDELRKGSRLINEHTIPWHGQAWLFSMATALERIGEQEEAREFYTRIADSIPEPYERTWGMETSAFYVLAILKKHSDGSSLSNFEKRFCDESWDELAEPISSSAIGRVVSHAAAGLLSSRGGDNAETIEQFVKANNERPGKLSACNSEWVTDKLVELLVEANELDRLEQILIRDVDRRDRQVSPIHPERAFVRLRLVQFLLDYDRELGHAHSLLDTAKQVFDYHDDMIPAVERERLTVLERRLESELMSNTNE